MSNDLLNELRTAYQARMAARGRWAVLRDAVGSARQAEREARAEYERTAAAIEEIERELVTGENSLPLFGGDNGRISTTENTGQAEGNSARTAAAFEARAAAAGRLSTAANAETPPENMVEFLLGVADGPQSEPVPPPKRGRGRPRKEATP